MRKHFEVCLLIITICQVCYGAKTRHSHIIEIQGTNYSRINDTLYAAQCDVSNGSYNNFLRAIRADSALYRSCLYDSTAWTAKFPFLNDTVLRSHYHNHPTFSNYPEVNISWYAAQKYCEWLTNEYNAHNMNNKAKYSFVLPTESEWIIMADTAAGGFPRDFSGGRDKQGRYNENINTFHGNYDTLAEDGGYFTVEVNAYAPDPRGLFNITGNVAEMTNQKDIEKVEAGGRNCRIAMPEDKKL